MQEAHRSQSFPIQKGKGVHQGPGKKKIRQQTKGIRRSEETHLQEEGQDHQEGRLKTRMQYLQEKEFISYFQMQVIRPRSYQTKISILNKLNNV